MLHKEDKLFRLIHSLSTSEKSYLKKYLHRESNQENTLVSKLFDIYNNLKEYDAQTIEKAIAKTSIEKQEGKVRTILQQKIIESLLLGKKNKLPYDQIISAIQEIRIMEEKHLYHEAKLIINKAKKIASASELFALWEILIQAERSFIPQLNPNPKTISKFFNANAEEKKIVAQHKKDEEKVTLLYINILSILTTTALEPIESLRNKASELMQSNIFDEAALAKRNDLLYTATKALYAILQKNHNDFSREENNLIEKIKHKDYQYCLSASKKIGLLWNIRFGIDNNVEERLSLTKELIIKLAEEALKTDPTQTPFIENVMFYIETEIASHQGKYEILIKKFKEKIRDKEKSVDKEIKNNLIDLYFDLAILYLCNKNYKEVIKTLNQIYLKTNKDYTAIKESEIIFTMILANIKLNQSDSIEVLSKDYLAVYNRHQLHLPVRKSIVTEIYANPYLDEAVFLNKIKHIVESFEEEDFVYANSLLDIKKWLNL